MSYKFRKNVIQAKREEGDESHGGILGQHSVAYADNTVQTLRVTEISERLPNKKSIGLEFITSDPPVSYSARMDQIVLSAVTHSITGAKQTYIEYSSDFSSDANMETI